MAIKNSDGTVYKLSSPNPVMKNQRKWNEIPMTFHNFEWTSITFPDKSTVGKPHKFEEDKVIEDIEKTIEVVVKETPVEKIIEKPKKEEKYFNDETDEFLKSRKIMIWCSPPVMTEHIDELYDEIHNTIEYKNKFSFEGVILSQTDLELILWAPVQLLRLSIIFPTKDRKRRCWKIIETENRDGTIARCIPSDISLDFSA